MPSGKHPTWAHSSRPRLRAASISESSRNTRVGSPGSTNIAAIITGRPLAAAMDSSHGTVEVMPLVSMKTPRPTSPSAPVSAVISRSSARRDGIGMPFSPLCCSRVEVAKPMAPVRRASTTMRRISAISASVAFRLLASSPST